jgi:hypothetical protein
LIVRQALALILLAYLLTRSALRWITLSFAGKKEGKEVFKKVNGTSHRDVWLVEKINKGNARSLGTLGK